MDITHIVWSFHTGGVETMLIDIMACQSSAGHHVCLIVVNDDYDPTLLARIPRHVRVELLHRRPGTRNPLHAVKLNSLVLCADIIHCHRPNIVQMLLPPLRFKTVVTVHSFQHLPECFPFVHRMVAVSHEVADDLRRQGYKHDIDVVHNGLPCSMIPYNAPGGYSPASATTFKIVQVGRLMAPTKGQDLLLHALGILRSQGINSVSVDFIGEGESEADLRSLAEELGVAERVSFLGCRSRHYIYAHLSDYHLMVHPARHEGFGLAVAEGMLAGLPVLVSQCGPLCSLVSGDRYGTTCRCDDADDCACMISSIMAHYDRALTKTAGARQHIADNYSMQRQVDAYQRIYQGQ